MGSARDARGLENSQLKDLGMNMRNLRDLKVTTAAVLTCAAVGLAGWDLGNTCQAQTSTNTPPTAGDSAPRRRTDLPPAVEDLVKLARAGLSEEVILAKIRNDGVAYNLTTDQIIYLSNEGVSQNVIAALMQTKPGSPAPISPSPAEAAPASAAPAPAEPPPLDSASPDASAASAVSTGAPVGVNSAPAPLPVAPALASGALVDSFAFDVGVNRALWATQSELLMRFAALKGFQHVPPALAFGPGGMRMYTPASPGRMTGMQSLGSFAAPFAFSAGVTGMAAQGVPFEVSLVSGDLSQWITIAGHLGGQRASAELVVGGGFGRVFRGGVALPFGASSPNYGIWLNYTGSGLPMSSLGYKFYEAPLAGVSYSVNVSAGPDGTASVSLVNASGFSLAARSGLRLGSGPFYVVLAGREGPAYGNWQSVQLNPMAPVVVPAPVAAVPATPTMDYFRGQLTPYGRWVEVPGNGPCWQPSVTPGWRPYYDGGHWIYTDEGWYWQSDYPWGDIPFHYG